MTYNKKGFTLVELMVVVAIIGLLAAIAVPMYQKYVLKSKLAEAYTTIRKIYDGAYILGSNPAGPTIDRDGRQHACAKRFMFGYFRSFIDSTNPDTTAPPYGGIKRPIYFEEVYRNNATPVTVVTYQNGGCVVSTGRGYNNVSVFGFSGDPVIGMQAIVTDPRHFAYANFPSSTLADNLTADGKNVAFTTPLGNSNVYKVNSIVAYADLDGDIDFASQTTCDPYAVCGLEDESERPETLTYISRGIYVNLDNGEIEGTAGLYTANLGE